MLPYWRLSAYYCVYFGFIGAFSPYFSLYLQSIGQSAADIAILMSLMQVMRVLAPNLWGWLAARLGWPVRIIQCSGFASLLGFLLFFVAAVSVTLMTLPAGNWPPRKRGVSVNSTSSPTG